MVWNRVTAGGGLLGAAIVAGAIITYNWGATPRLDGSITSVRTLGMDASNSVAIVNFEAVNTSNREIAINFREIDVTDSTGALRRGRILSVFDVEQLFKYYPALGGMRDEPLTDNRYVAAGETVRGLVAARFEMAKHELDLRKDIVFRTIDRKNREVELRHEAEADTSERTR